MRACLKCKKMTVIDDGQDTNATETKLYTQINVVYALYFIKYSC